MTKFVYSYCGYYKNLYLRSSYEYLFCKILEKQNIKFKIEECKYMLENGKYYIPDFFIYDKEDNLVEIVEIKSEAKSIKNKGIKNIELLRKLVDVKCSIYFLKDLIILCDKLNINYKKCIEYWKSKNNSKKRSILSKSVKESIGLKTKERMQNEEWKEYWKSQIKKSAKNWSYKLEGERVARKNRICPVCGKTFRCIKTDNKIYCSIKCASKGTAKQQSKTKINKSNEKRLKIKNKFYNNIKYSNDFDIKEYIISFYKNEGFVDVRPLSFILINTYTKNINKLITLLDINSKYMPNLQNDKL